MGRRGLWACSSIQSNEITCNWYMRRSCLFSICLHFATVCLFYENFWVEKKFSDIIQTFHRDQLEKNPFLIVYKCYLYEDEMFGWCQTQLIFFIFFLNLFCVMNPKIFVLEAHVQNEKTRNANVKNLSLNVFLTNIS